MGHLFSNLFKGVTPQAGELTINLNLTIKIEADGSLNVTPTVGPAPSPSASLPGKSEEPKTLYEIPDLEIKEENLINFGKNV